MQAFPHSGSENYNYKDFHSLILMAICDAKYRFLAADFGSSGRRGDGNVYLLRNHSLKFEITTVARAHWCGFEWRPADQSHEPLQVRSAAAPSIGHPQNCFVVPSAENSCIYRVLIVKSRLDVEKNVGSRRKFFALRIMYNDTDVDTTYSNVLCMK